MSRALAATGVAGRPAEHLRSAAGPVPERFEDLASSATENGVVGTRLQWHHLAELLRDLRLEDPAAAVGDDAAVIAGALGRPRWIHLWREDTARQAISHYRALFSGVSSVEADAEPPAAFQPRRPNLQHVRWLEDMLIAHEAEWRRFFSEAGIVPLQLTYEDLDTRFHETVAAALDHVGIDPPAELEDLAPPLRRLADARSVRWAARYGRRRLELAPQPIGEAWADLDRRLPAQPRRPSGDPPRPGPAPRPAGSIRFSCVVDARPVYMHQSLIWALSLLRLAGRPPEELVAHVIKGVPRRHADQLRSLGVTVVPIRPFDRRSPFANKLGQLSSGALDDAETVVLCDCDVAFVEDPSGLFPPDAIGGTVGGASLYHEFVLIARAAGLPAESLPLARAIDHVRWTCASNLNGGFITVPRAHFAALADGWPRWLMWVLEQQQRFEHRVPSIAHFADQVAFALAVIEGGLPFSHLPYDVNRHAMPGFSNRDVGRPLVLHYHRNLTDDGLIGPTGVPALDDASALVNAMLRSPEASGVMGPASTRWSEHTERRRLRDLELEEPPDDPPGDPLGDPLGAPLAEPGEATADPALGEVLLDPGPPGT